MGKDTLTELLQRIEALGRENALLRNQLQERATAEQPPFVNDLPYRRLFENHSVVMLLLDPADGAIVNANKAAVAFYGYPQEALLQLHIADLDLSDRLISPLTLERDNEIHHRVRARHRLASGEIRDVELIASLVTMEEGERPLLYCVIQDVTERYRANQTLRRSERRFRQLVEAAADAVYCIDSRGYFAYANPVALRLFGYTRDELRSLHFTDLVRPDYHLNVHTFYTNQAVRQVPNTYHEFPALARDGREIWIGQNVQLLCAGRRILGYQGIARNISERKRTEQPVANLVAHLHRRNRRLLQQLARLQRTNMSLGDLALTDYLTGLRNHRAFQEELEQAFQHARATGTPLSLILIDLDGFKQVNDTRGHPAGDAVLQAVGTLLRDQVRATDIVARYGGEEFTIILPFTDQTGAVAQAERFRVQIEIAQAENGVTGSFGVASLTPEICDRQQLIKQADAALYAAKRAGRNSVRHYALLTPDVRASVSAIVEQHPAAEGPDS